MRNTDAHKCFHKYITHIYLLKIIKKNLIKTPPPNYQTNRNHKTIHGADMTPSNPELSESGKTSHFINRKTHRG